MYPCKVSVGESGVSMALLFCAHILWCHLHGQNSCFLFISASALLPLFFCLPDECITLLKIQLLVKSVIYNFKGPY
jgi:hypothetical protein